MQQPEQLPPDTQSSDYVAQLAYWTMVAALQEGEAAVKAKKETYLPKFASEEQTVYDARLKATPYTNLYGDISKALAAKPFSKELKLKEGAPSQYDALSENIDGCGRNLHVFAQESFNAALNAGIDWIFVDYTRARQNADGKPLTAAQETEQKLRPYWVRIPALNMLAAYSAFIGGEEIIYHARFREDAIQIQQYKEVTIERVRVLLRDPVVDARGNVTSFGAPRWELWEKVTGEVKGETQWLLKDVGTFSIDEIPLVPVVLTKRVSNSWQVVPALRDLAYMQLSEYRQESNLEWIKVMTCYPMFSISGISPVDDKGQPVKVKVGPSVVVIIPPNASGTGAAGELKAVEPGAASIQEVRAQLELTRKEMRDLGMQPLAEANLTVVTSAHVSKKASSAVEAWAYLFKDQLERAWKLTAKWLGDDKFEPEVVIFTDFSIDLEQGNELDALLKSEAQSVLSKQTVRDELRRRKVVASDVSEEDEQQRLAEEQATLGPEQPIDPRTGQPLDPTLQQPPKKTPTIN